MDLADPGTCYGYFFSYCHSHNASKECFWQKKFQISCTGLKVPFWKNCQNDTFEPKVPMNL